LIQQVVGNVVGLAQHNRNTVSYRVDTDVDTVVSDEVKVRQILTNLLSNACKFTENGKIEVTANRLKFEGRRWLCMAVSDTGIGIAESEISKLFKEFSQADPSPTRNYEGTGLGLALSQKFAHMLGGLITLETEEGTGSTFKVLLPDTGESTASDS
jgi:signal transduction histidine kinase